MSRTSFNIWDSKCGSSHHCISGRCFNYICRCRRWLWKWIYKWTKPLVCPLLVCTCVMKHHRNECRCVSITWMPVSLRLPIRISVHRMNEISFHKPRDIIIIWSLNWLRLFMVHCALTIDDFKTEKYENIKTRSLCTAHHRQSIIIIIDDAFVRKKCRRSNNFIGDAT